MDLKFNARDVWTLTRVFGKNFEFSRENIFKKTERRSWVDPLRLYLDFDEYMNQLADALLSLDKDPFTGLLPLFFSFALYYMYSWICFVCFNPCYGDFCTALCVPTSIHAKILDALKKITV